MLSDCEPSSGENDDYEMNNVSETTPLVSSEELGDENNSSVPAAKSSANIKQVSSNCANMAERRSGSILANCSSGFDIDQDDQIVNSEHSDTADRNNSASGDAMKNHDDHRTTTPYVVLLSVFSAIGGFLFGYDTGVVSGAMLLLKDEFSLSSVEQEVVVSVTIGAACLAALLGGYLSDRFGRKVCTLFASFVFTVGALLLGVAQNLTMLIIGRLTLGIGIGVASMTVPVYIAEIAPAHLRGRLVTVNVLFITGGQFIASLLDGAFSYLKHNGWRYMLGLAGVPSLIQLVGFLFLPESPRYMVKRGNEERARQILQRVRGTVDVQQELNEIKENCRQDEEARRLSKGPTILLMLKNSRMRRALVVGCGLQLFQQLSGINTVMYYSASIIKMSGINNQHTAIWLAAMTAGVNFVFTLVGVWLVERIGRKPLILSSLAGVIISLVVLAVGFELAAFHSPPINFNETQHNSSCSSYSYCEPCIEDSGCGFCYEDVAGKAVNGSCVAVVTKDGSYAKDGRCSANMTEDGGSAVWAPDFCPTAYSWISIFGLCLYLMFFAPGMGPMPWTINSEIYPLWARSTGNSLSAATNWISNLLVSMTFLTLTETLTKYGTYWLFVGVATLGFFFFWLLLPETRGRKLEDVEELFACPWCSCCKSENKPTAKYRTLN